MMELTGIAFHASIIKIKRITKKGYRLVVFKSTSEDLFGALRDYFVAYPDYYIRVLVHGLKKKEAFNKKIKRKGIKKMASINKDGDWLNRNGKWTPAVNVQPHLKRRDAAVMKIVDRSLNLQARMIKEKAFLIGQVMKYIEYLKRQHGITEKSIDGNLTLSNYANTYQVDISINDMITFDERLNIAKTLIDNCLRRWTKRGRVEMRAIVGAAFNVDKKGKVNKYLILGLRNLNIRDKEWNRAMGLIINSMQVSGTRQYITFRTRADKDSKWDIINLNFSSLQIK